MAKKSQTRKLKILSDKWQHLHILDGDTVFYEPCKEVTAEGLYVLLEEESEKINWCSLKMFSEPETEEDKKFAERQEMYKDLFNQDAEKYDQIPKAEPPKIRGRVVKVEREHFFLDSRYGVLNASIIGGAKR